MKDYYKILDVPRTANLEEIKRAYRKLAFQFHPDRNSDSSAVLRMKEINEAYDVLGDEVKRKSYNYRLENRETYRAASQTRTYTQTNHQPRTHRSYSSWRRYRIQDYDLSGWAIIARYVAGFIALYCGLLVLDYFVSQSYDKVKVNYMTSYSNGSGKSSSNYRNYEVESDKINFSLSSFYFINPGDTLSLKITPFFGIVSDCEKISEGDRYPMELRTVYSPMFLIVLLSLGFSIAAIRSKSHQQIVSYGIASIFFFFIALNMMY